MGKEKQELVEKIEWIKREMNALGKGNNSDNLNDLLKYQLYRKLENYQLELGQIIYDELDDVIKNDIQESREKNREGFYKMLREKINE
jgi:hypothetical protein